MSTLLNISRLLRAIKRSAQRFTVSQPPHVPSTHNEAFVKGTLPRASLGQRAAPFMAVGVMALSASLASQGALAGRASEQPVAIASHTSIAMVSNANETGAADANLKSAAPIAPTVAPAVVEPPTPSSRPEPPAIEPQELTAPNESPAPPVVEVLPPEPPAAEAEPPAPAEASEPPIPVEEPRIEPATRGDRSADPAPVKPMTKEEKFIAEIVPGAQRSQQETGVPTSVALAQAILESNWGNSTLATDGKNLFGIKATSGPGSAGTINLPTKEVINGRTITVNAAFRAYQDIADSLVDHGRFLSNNGRYSNAFNHQDDPKEFARQIHKAGYATDPDYANKLIRLMDKYNLYQYDVK